MVQSFCLHVPIELPKTAASKPRRRIFGSLTVRLPLRTQDAIGATDTEDMSQKGRHRLEEGSVELVPLSCLDSY